MKINDKQQRKKSMGELREKQFTKNRRVFVIVSKTLLR